VIHRKRSCHHSTPEAEIMMTFPALRAESQPFALYSKTGPRSVHSEIDWWMPKFSLL
jgi:hypothetical protein